MMSSCTLESYKVLYTKDCKMDSCDIALWYTGAVTQNNKNCGQCGELLHECVMHAEDLIEQNVSPGPLYSTIVQYLPAEDIPWL